MNLYIVQMNLYIVQSLCGPPTDKEAHAHNKLIVSTFRVQGSFGTFACVLFMHGSLFGRLLRSFESLWLRCWGQRCKPTKWVANGRKESAPHAQTNTG